MLDIKDVEPGDAIVDPVDLTHPRIVTTQAELDAAIRDGVMYVDIELPAGVWVTVTACGSSMVRAWGSSMVIAYDSSMVIAYDSSAVTAYDSSMVIAYDSSTVRAYDSSTVTAYDSSTVTATRRVAVHLHTGTAKLSGGVIIDHTINLTDPAEWCADNGVTVTKAGVATLYKAVDDNWTTIRGTSYKPGSKPSCDDWRDDHECGGGLHLSPTPWQAKEYHREATRFVAVGVKVSDLRPIPGGVAKAKVPCVVRKCVEVDLDGNQVQ